VHVRPIDEADMEQQRRREAARLYRDRHHISNDDTISNFEDLSIIGGALETVEQVREYRALAIRFASYFSSVYYRYSVSFQQDTDKTVRSGRLEGLAVNRADHLANMGSMLA